MTCVFCEIIKGTYPEPHEVVWKDDAHVAFLSHRPEQSGHVVLVPRKHIEYAFDLSPEDFLSLMTMAHRLAVALKKAQESARIALSIIGFEVPHAHVHLVPVNTGADAHVILPPDWIESPEKLAVMGEKLRIAFSTV